ncbi:hypothetical protein SAMN05660662_1603 [Blastococcus aurantiacus]|uniref:Uncharacterized protein n=1 Tax=Blastococcus aurantiacus TaxID=1550231 RepID=A0A1G7JMR5_9ACTN|nr:hypothetical protein [Blastococcus aurantiacus]SDF26181.1 hypothetical protein SAMN05660662_1603 [Blastococcus aurantiacus]
MPRRDPQRARVLGLWTAGWLAVFLVVGMLWLGEPSVQWPVLAVPLLWALLALRPRRRGATVDDGYDEEPGYWDDDDWADDDAAPPHRDAPPGPRPAERTDTVERPALRRPSGYDEWDGRRRG